MLFFKIWVNNRRKKIFGPKWISIFGSQENINLIKLIIPLFIGIECINYFLLGQAISNFKSSSKLQLKKLSGKKFFRIIFNIKLTIFNKITNSKERKVKFYFSKNSFMKNSIYLLFSHFDQDKTKEGFCYTIDPVFHGKDLLWNDITDIFLYNDVNYYKNNIRLSSILLISISADSLWMLEGQYEKFWKRKIHGSKVNLPPSIFIEIFGHKNYKHLFQKESNTINPVFKKKILKECYLREISCLIKVLIGEVKNLFDSQYIFPEFIHSLRILANSFISYAEYNKNSQKRTKKNHLRTNIRNLEKYMILKTIEPTNNPKKNCLHYRFLLDLLKNLENVKDYEPIDLFPLLPLNKHQRANILETVSLPFPFQILQYSPGGNKRKVVICWKVPLSKEYRNEFKTNLIISREKIKFPIYLSRAMMTANYLSHK
nr:hypothetical protein 1634Bnrm3_p069 [Cryptomonas sp.]